MFVNPQNSILLPRFLRNSYKNMSYGCPAMLKTQGRNRCGLKQMGIYHVFVQGVYPSWFQRHRNSIILKRYFQLLTIIGVQLDVSLSSCLYRYVTLNSCSYLKKETLLRNVQVSKGSSVSKNLPDCWHAKEKFVVNFSSAERFKYVFHSYENAYHDAYSKETKQLYFKFTCYLNLSDVFQLYCRVWSNCAGTII